IRLGRRERLRAGAPDLGREARQLVEIASRPEEDHAAVPVVLTRGDEVLRDGRARLLHEARNAMDRAAGWPPMDVAVAGLRGRRHDAEGDELSLLRGAKGRPDRLVEGG